jgi:hypothetical protein
MEWLEISQFMMGRVEKHFKLRADTAGGNGNNNGAWVEKHFKLRNNNL